MPQTSSEKIVTRYAVGLAPGDGAHAGDYVTIRPKHVMTHDNTGAVIPKFRSIVGDTRQVAYPKQPVFGIDHDIQNTTPENLGKYAKIQKFAADQGIDYYPPGRGIAHQIMVEEGYVTPGALVVGSDSHSNLYGAIAAVNALVEQHHGALYQAVNGWFAEMQAAFNDNAEGSAQQIAQRLARAEVLVLDDLGAEYIPRGSEWKTSETEMLINERWEWRRPTLITTNLDPAALGRHVQARTASRFLDYEQVQVGGADMRGGWRA